MTEPNKEVKSIAKRKPPAAGMGRVKGTPNKTTALLKEAIILAAEQQGHDGKGKNGLTGYCQYLAKDEPKAFAALLGKVLPLQITGDGDGPLVVEVLRFSNAKNPAAE